MPNLSDKTLGHSYIPDNGANCLAAIVVNQGLDLIEKFSFLIRTIRAAIPSPSQLDSPNCLQIKIQALLNLCIRTSV